MRFFLQNIQSRLSNVLIDFKLQRHAPTDAMFYHRLAEAFKFAFAERMTLGDDRFVDITAVR